MPADVLVTGGAGFVGANLCVALAERHPDWDILALDSLYRRGSELNLPRLRDAGVEFVRGDVRSRDDLAAVGEIGALVECSAEPSALAGVDGDVDYLVDTNLIGAYNCLEICRRNDARLVFLSTSRVYPVEAQRALAYEESETRFELLPDQPLPGASGAGISEAFPLEGARTLYGATKLAAELLITEYAAAFGLTAVVDRCGVVAGPWQMGKVDQGVFTHWVVSHYANRELSYIGFGGAGKQVRDLVHVDDLVDLVDQQLREPERWRGATVNVGGGRAVSLSLAETTAICRELTGNAPAIGAVAETRPGDVPLYLSDCAKLSSMTDWRPRRSAEQTLTDIFEWVRANERAVLDALGI
ncbi:MAG: CDP-paratose 2-epimerase [Thermoleophilales bacterium]|nr:CDP-paratose 2-epimerase [Thermoleophilales bacterium]